MPVKSNSEQKQTSTYLKVQNRCYASKAILFFMTKKECENKSNEKIFSLAVEENVDENKFQRMKKRFIASNSI